MISAHPHIYEQKYNITKLNKIYDDRYINTCFLNWIQPWQKWCVLSLLTASLTPTLYSNQILKFDCIIAAESGNMNYSSVNLIFILLMIPFD